MASLDSFLTGFLPRVPDCPDPTAQFWLREACADFCERTGIWRQSLSCTFNAAGVVNITAALPAGATLANIELARIGGVTLEPKPERDLDADMPGWRDGELVGTPAYIGQDSFDTAIVVPATGSTGTVSLVVSLKPSTDSADIPDVLFTQYRNVIMDGAYASLAMIPGKAWSAPELGIAARARFDEACWRAKLAVQKGQQKGRLRVRGSFM